DRVRHRQRQVLVGVDADLGALVEDVAVGADPVTDAVHGEPATGVGDVDAVRAIAFHQLGLRGEFGGRGHVAHHEEAGDVHADLTGGRDVLGGDVGLGAVGGDSHRPHAQVVGAAKIFDRADARQQQGGQPRAADVGGRGLDPGPVAVRAGTVVDRAAGETVTVGDFDGVDARGVERRDDLAHVLRGDPVPDGVHAVAQG